MKIKHKWYKHLFVKYKYVKVDNEIREYSQIRIWIALLIWLIGIIISPLIVLIYGIIHFKENVTFPMGQDGYEEYAIYKVKQDVH